ncbi:MAG: outer membrane lipoprotein chaperone LolA [Alphaproteobacteria bacterium]
MTGRLRAAIPLLALALLLPTTTTRATAAPRAAARRSASPPSPAPRAGTLDAAAATRKVQDRYDSTETFTANFDQEMRLASGGQVLRSAGRVWFQRPGRMLWRYEAPEEQVIVADGEHLWVHQPADRQVLRAPLRDAFESRTPVSFLLGVARVERDFSATLLPAAGDGSVRLQLEPRDDPEGALGTLVLELDPVTFDIRAAIIRDPIGNTTRVVLRDLIRNQPLDPALFRFEPPAGTDVIEAPGR